MSRCEKYIEMAGLYLDGELDAEGQKELLGHIRSCAACRSYYETMRAVSLSLGEVSAPEGFAAGVMDAVRAAKREADNGEAEPAVRAKPRRRLSALKIGALAACMALIVAAGVKVGANIGGGDAATGDENRPAMFDSTGAEGEASPEEVVERDLPEEDAYVNTVEAPAGSAVTSCAGAIDSVTVESGGVVTHTSDGELIETMAELLRFESKAAEVPEGEADYVLTVECGGEERSFSVWDVDGGLVCSPDDGRAWNAAGTAEAFAEAAG